MGKNHMGKLIVLVIGAALSPLTVAETLTALGHDGVRVVVDDIMEAPRMPAELFVNITAVDDGLLTDFPAITERSDFVSDDNCDFGNGAIVGLMYSDAPEVASDHRTSTAASIGLSQTLAIAHSAGGTERTAVGLTV